MDDDTPRQMIPPKTLWMHVRHGVAEAHRRRPVSFYMLLTIPVVMALGAKMGDYRNDPYGFVTVLGLLFIFFLVILTQAVRDFFQITRKHLAESKAAYRETVGDGDFLNELGKRVKGGKNE